jgi:hypothetical protein
MTLAELLRALWSRRWRIALAVSLLYAACAALVLLWPRSFVATAIVAPAETTGIATSTFLTPAPLLPNALLDNRPSGNFAVYLAAIRSPEAAGMLARETAILADLTERRDAWPLGPLRRLLGLRVLADADDVLAFLEQQVAATASLASVTWTVELVHRDRGLALEMLRRLHALGEQRVRDGLAELTSRRIFALEARLAAEPDLFLRSTLHELLAQQQRAALVVAADEAVAARLVSVPVVELRASVPNRPLLLVLLLVAVPGAVLLLFAAAALLRGPDYARPAWPPVPRPAAAQRVPADHAC